VSFTLHATLLATLMLFAIVIPQARRPRPITVSTEVADHTAEFVSTELNADDLSGSLAAEHSTVLSAGDIVERSYRVPLNLSVLLPGGAGGAGLSAGTGRRASTRSDLPPNAVEAGSFAAWWIPKVERYGEKVEPGQLPRVNQPYFIHVQIRVPDDRRTLRVDDLSGEIIGTDGYRQPIPDRAWVLDDSGALVRAVGGRSFLRVAGGLVEVVFKVDGAGQAGVRDTIRIRSQILGEEQTLMLEFQPVAAAQ
jgi:hypothetical protein